MKKHYIYSQNNYRENILDHLKISKYDRVLDVGYSINTWSSKFTTHYVDINYSDSNKIFFKGDINMPFVWEEIKNDVEKNGKFDFSICTRTLEDIINPYYVCLMLQKFSKMGFIAVPSKYKELKREIEGSYRGYIHHRYIFNKENEEFIAYPKLNFIENFSDFDKIEKNQNENNSELQFFWEDEIGLKIINDNFMGPNINDVLNYYNGLFN